MLPRALAYSGCHNYHPPRGSRKKNQIHPPGLAARALKKSTPPGAAAKKSNPPPRAAAKIFQENAPPGVSWQKAQIHPPGLIASAPNFSTLQGERAKKLNPPPLANPPPQVYYDMQSNVSQLYIDHYCIGCELVRALGGDAIQLTWKASAIPKGPSDTVA